MSSKLKLLGIEIKKLSNPNQRLQLLPLIFSACYRTLKHLETISILSYFRTTKVVLAKRFVRYHEGLSPVLCQAFKAPSHDDPGDIC